MPMVSTENINDLKFVIMKISIAKLKKITIIGTYWSSTITSLRFVCVLASLRAKSLASDPELTKKHTFNGDGSRLVSLSAYITRLSWRNLEFVFNVFSWL